MAAPDTVTTNGDGLTLGGLCADPFYTSNLSPEPFLIDGTGLVTNGLLWSTKAIWYPQYAAVTTTWSAQFSNCNCD